MCHIICPYCKEFISDWHAPYCPWCGAVFDLPASKQREKDIETCIKEAQHAVAEENWRQARLNLISVLRRSPKHAQALRLMEIVREEQKFARLYDLAQYHRSGKRWDKATDYLLQIDEHRPDYRDVAEVLEKIEREKWNAKRDPRRIRRADRAVRFVLACLLLIFLALTTYAIILLLIAPGGILAR